MYKLQDAPSGVSIIFEHDFEYATTMAVQKKFKDNGEAFEKEVSSVIEKGVIDIKNQYDFLKAKGSIPPLLTSIISADRDTRVIVTYDTRKCIVEALIVNGYCRISTASFDLDGYNKQSISFKESTLSYTPPADDSSSRKRGQKRGPIAPVSSQIGSAAVSDIPKA